jgi:hypothetical protein
VIWLGSTLEEFKKGRCIEKQCDRHSMEEGLPRNLQGILRLEQEEPAHVQMLPLHVPLILKLENTAVVMDDRADCDKGPIMNYVVETRNGNASVPEIIVRAFAPYLPKSAWCEIFTHSITTLCRKEHKL